MLRGVCAPSMRKGPSAQRTFPHSGSLSIAIYLAATASAPFGDILAIENIHRPKVSIVGSRDLHSMRLAAKWAQSYARLIQWRLSGSRQESDETNGKTIGCVSMKRP